MSGLLRNAPCPCGSGRKYKQCCLHRDEEEQARRRHRDRGVEIALDWLTERFPKEYEAAVLDGFFAALGESERAAVGDLDAPARAMIDQNIGEWLLADGVLELEVEGEKVERRVADLVLGPQAPPLASDQRELLEGLRDRPLRLYEVAAAVAGRGLTLRDALEPAEPFELGDPYLADRLEPGEFVGLRVLAAAGACEPSGALYAFSAAAGSEVLARLREELEAFAADADADPAELRRRVVCETIIDAWLAGLTGPVAVGEGATPAEAPEHPRS